MQLLIRFQKSIIGISSYFFIGLAFVGASNTYSDELIVQKSCPVSFKDDHIGTLVISKPWFHASRMSASYHAMDDATGIGVEIHFFANKDGDIRHNNLPNCDGYRLLQIRNTNARLDNKELPLQLDIPPENSSPYYDNYPLEYGHGTHQTPADNLDKPWSGRPIRSSTVGIYDTPYITDAYGIEGEDIFVKFETCAVCERDHTFDSVLGCITWGYEREYMGGQTGWAEPETLENECFAAPTENMYFVMKNSSLLAYYLNY